MDARAQDEPPPYPYLLLSIAGGVLFASGIAFQVISNLAAKFGYGLLLEKGTVVDAIVKKHQVANGMVRELKYHKPVITDGVLSYEREWVMQSVITQASGHTGRH